MHGCALFRYCTVESTLWIHLSSQPGLGRSSASSAQDQGRCILSSFVVDIILSLLFWWVLTVKKRRHHHIRRFFGNKWGRRLRWWKKRKPFKNNWRVWPQKRMQLKRKCKSKKTTHSKQLKIHAGPHLTRLFRRWLGNTLNLDSTFKDYQQRLSEKIPFAIFVKQYFSKWKEDDYCADSWLTWMWTSSSLSTRWPSVLKSLFGLLILQKGIWKSCSENGHSKLERGHLEHF